MTLLESKTSHLPCEQEVKEDESQTTEVAESITEELNLDLINSAEEQKQSSSLEDSISPNDSERFASHLPLKGNSTHRGANKRLTVRFEQPAMPSLTRNKTQIGLKPSILRSRQL